MADATGGAPTSGKDPGDDAFGTIFDHPDLRDETWLAQAGKQATRDAKRARRRGAIRVRWKRAGRTGLGHRSLTVVALAGVGLLAAGLLMLRESVEDETGQPLSPGTAVDLGHPFAGTPAAHWADGEAGLVAPEAEAVGAYTAEKVADAYAWARRFLITARLDPAVIVGHDVERPLRLLGRADAMAQRTGTRAQMSNWLTWIADGNRLLPAPPKVSGRMWAAVDDHGVLEIHTDYVFAYAFDPERPETITSAYDVVAIDRAAVTFVHSRGGPPEDLDMKIGETAGYFYSMSCSEAENGELAPAYRDRQVGPGGGFEPPSRFFDPNSSLTTDDKCD
ncbi:hypothetical protein V5P93_007248 [Actinokineospora auranticolor]|uniref:Uncharacterized protein n=1 Tax=Actinokineospora auranticolor TaxID=155976 RepID=A0A2S6GRP4_9PSEU|nr:hypothetical protein [Actinokineospora auranticolor]PPK67904.1 hypothetical protein CLV40_106135 [Actinokineospora auranticolor]